MENYYFDGLCQKSEKNILQRCTSTEFSFLQLSLTVVNNISMFRPMLLNWNNRHMTSFADETGEVLLPETTFVRFGSSSKTTGWSVVLFWAVPHSSMIGHL